MNTFDFDKIVDLPEIKEINRVVSVFHVYYHRAPDDMVIEVIEYAKNCFMGVCNYGIWGPEQADAYKSIHSKNSVEEALNDALKGIRAFDSATIPNDLLFWVSDSAIYDGDGEKITRQEAEDRRCKNSNKFIHQPWTQTLINGGPWWLISKNFDTKQFSVIGPIDDDSEYINKASNIQKRGIDFRTETVPASKQSKEELIQYFKDTFGMKFVSNDELYTV
jgi:hypothetical protein